MVDYPFHYPKDVLYHILSYDDNQINKEKFNLCIIELLNMKDRLRSITFFKNYYIAHNTHLKFSSRPLNSSKFILEHIKKYGNQVYLYDIINVEKEMIKQIKHKF